MIQNCMFLRNINTLQFHKTIFNPVHVMLSITIYLTGSYHSLDEMIKGFLNLIVSFKFRNSTQVDQCKT